MAACFFKLAISQQQLDLNNRQEIFVRIAVLFSGKAKTHSNILGMGLINERLIPFIPVLLVVRFLECVRFYSEQGETMQSALPAKRSNAALDEKGHAVAMNTMNRQLQVERVY